MEAEKSVTEFYVIEKEKQKKTNKKKNNKKKKKQPTVTDRQYVADSFLHNTNSHTLCLYQV